MTATRIGNLTYVSDDRRFRIWFGLPDQVEILEPLPGYEYSRTRDGRALFRLQYDRSHVSFRTPDGVAHVAEIDAFHDLACEEYWQHEEAAKEARRAAEADLERVYSRPWGVTGDAEDIEANYEGGLAAFRRDEARDRDRTPY